MYCSESSKENGESNPFRSRNNLLTAIFFRMCYSNGADNLWAIGRTLLNSRSRNNFLTDYYCM